MSAAAATVAVGEATPAMAAPSQVERLDEVRCDATRQHVATLFHRVRVCRPQAERLLVSGAFAEAANEAAGLLAQQLARDGGGSPGEASQEEEDVRLAAAAVLLQARLLAGDSPAAVRAALEAGFGSLRAVPPESLELWCVAGAQAQQHASSKRCLSLNTVHLLAKGPPGVEGRPHRRHSSNITGGLGIRCVLTRSCCALRLFAHCGASLAEPSERLAHPAEGLTQLARVLALDVLTTAAKDPGTALKWLAVDGVAVMTHDTRRELMREVNARKLDLEQLNADASAQWANAKAEAQKHSRGGGGQQRAQPPPRAGPAPPARPRAAKPPPEGGNALSRFVSRSRAAAQADPEGAACVALLAGCAVYALTADRRGLRQALGTVGAALSSLATMAIGGTTAAV